MRRIPLTQGQTALVDDDDYGHLIVYKWCAQKSKKMWYAVRNSSRIDGKRSQIRMHVEIGRLHGISDRLDHKNGNGCDNQKENLRPATSSQNSQNRRKIVMRSSRFKGVHWNNKLGKWQAEIQRRGRFEHLGLFAQEEAAAAAYDQAAKEQFGTFALLNRHFSVLKGADVDKTQKLVGPSAP